MAQPSSHQIKLNLGDQPKPNRTKFRERKTSAKTNKSYIILLCPVVAGLFVLLVFWRQYSTPIRAITSVGIHNADHEDNLLAPGTTTPAIKLHPEDHVYREPKTQHLDWTLSSRSIRPDGVLKRVHLINGKG